MRKFAYIVVTTILLKTVQKSDAFIVVAIYVATYSLVKRMLSQNAPVYDITGSFESLL